MKKVIFLCSLLSFARMIKCEDVANEVKKSVHQDVKMFALLSSIQMPRAQETASLTANLIRVGSALFSEVKACEEAKNCDKSEELERLFREFSTLSLLAQDKAEELKNSAEAQQIREIFEKYRQ